MKIAASRRGAFVSISIHSYYDVTMKSLLRYVNSFTLYVIKIGIYANICNAANGWSESRVTERVGLASRSRMCMGGAGGP